MEKRVRFDFEVAFLNGGGLQGQDFRLDLDSDDISDDELADYIVRDLRLLMAGPVRILNKAIIEEAHRRSPSSPDGSGAATGAAAFVDLSHVIEDGMITYRGLPAPLVCDFLSREDSRAHYSEGTEFHIGRIDMVANTGTYIDSPYHRFADGADVSRLDLASVAGLPGVVVRVTGMTGRAIGRNAFAATDVRGRAVLVHTGWAAHWRSDRYFEGHPFLTEDAAEYLRNSGAVLVGIDSMNIDDNSGGERPVHTVLLGAGIPIVEHMRGLEQLPVTGFRFSAVPAKVQGLGSFPVRAFAVLDD